MRLVRGATIDQAAAALDQVRVALDKIEWHIPLEQEYLAWAEDAETALRPFFAEPDIAEHLFTTRYWQIYNDRTDYEHYAPNHAMPDPGVAERSKQAIFLNRLAEQLVALREQAARPGRLLVYDTNSLMHYQPPTLLPWVKLAGSPQVRLIVPLIVVDELDAKKYSGTGKMGERAAAVLRVLDGLLDGVAPGALVSTTLQC